MPYKKNILVKTKSKVEKIETRGDGFCVWVNAVPQKGAANEAVLRLLAAHLNILKGKIKIIRGLKSKNKLVLIS
jgi:uncharacterized protein YggU (UPF0235/DUF167 family)